MKTLWKTAAAIAVAFASLPVGAALVSVESIQKLREYGSTGDDVVVLDYYAHSGTTDGERRDRGGGLFRWAPSSRCPTSEDGGRFINSTNGAFSGKWERVFHGETPNVKMWGAVGDCTIDGSGYVSGTDDTSAFQKMFDGVSFGRNYNEVIIPKGNYRVTQAITIPGDMRIRGEAGWANSQISMTHTSADNIFITADAKRMLQGVTSFPGNGNFVNVSTQTVYMAHGLTIEGLSFYFGDPSRSGQTNAAILLASPGDTLSLDRIVSTGGGYGIRALWGGQPGLKVFNSSFFNQCVAGIAIEGVKLTGGNTVIGTGGPITLSNISGDSFSSSQYPNNSLILFTNYAPVATINDISGEGIFGKGLIRCIMPPALGVLQISTINVHGGQYNSGGDTNYPGTFYVVENPTSDTYYTPVYSMEAVGTYYNANLIKDLWVNRTVVNPSFDTTSQVPIYRPLQYFSAMHDATNNSVLTIGDTVYQHFIPATNGWYRIALMPSWTTHLGAKFAINSWDDSSAFEVNLETTAVAEMNIVRHSKAVSSTPNVSKVRAVSFYDSTLGYRRGAVEVYVQSTPAAEDYSNGWVYDTRRICVTMSLEGNERNTTKSTALVQPRGLGGSVTDTSNLLSNESSPTTTGVISLLR